MLLKIINYSVWYITSFNCSEKIPDFVLALSFPHRFTISILGVWKQMNRYDTIYVFCNLVSTWWQPSVNLYKDRKTVSCIERRNNTQNGTKTQNTWHRKKKHTKRESKHKKVLKTIKSLEHNKDKQIIMTQRTAQNIIQLHKCKSVITHRFHERSEIFIYLLTYSLHGAKSFLSSWLACS